MRRGPNFLPPPREVVLAIQRRAGGSFWNRFTAALDRALPSDATLVNWYRSPQHNARVGGALNSQHRWGTALDVVVAPSQRAATIARLRRETFFVIDEGDHLHVQAFPRGRL